MRILFIGNSHTYFNGMPFMVRHMLRQGGRPQADVSMVAPDGRPLAWHAKEPTTRFAIRMHPWDRIVLQQQTHPFAGYDALAEDFAGLEPHLRFAGAPVTLCMVWCRKGQAELQPEIDAAAMRLAQEQRIALAPVSRAWHRIQADRPDIELYQPDGSHASPAGSYLAACIYFGLFMHRSPAGQDARIEAGGMTLVDLPRDAADALQEAAWQALQFQPAQQGVA